jgi:class 3 adenylate cyclase
MRPEIRYARSGDVSIAYAEVGEGPLDLVFVHGYVGNLEVAWQQPLRVAFFERLTSFARVIEFDRRGTGLSDRVRDVPTLETRMDDLRAVMDAAGSDRAALVATFEAASMAALFAATYPERVAALLMYNPIAKGVWAEDYPFAPTEEEWRQELAEVRERWGESEYLHQFARAVAPSRADDAEFLDWFVSALRLGASPGAAVAIHRMTMDIDIRDVLPSIHVPTLILHRPVIRHRLWKRGEANYVAELIPDAKLVEIGGPDTLFFLADGFADEVERFVRGAWPEPEPDTVLATVLFTDIVGSTTRAAELGDRAWRELLGRHHALVRTQLARFRGTEIDTAGDGFFASFDGPARAIRCACVICDAVPELGGLQVRAGLHTGECERLDGKIGGLAVHIGARVARQAHPGEVLVSSTVKDLVAGSGLSFQDRGLHRLKGVPEEWRLFAVSSRGGVGT